MILMIWYTRCHVLIFVMRNVQPSGFFLKIKKKRNVVPFVISNSAYLAFVKVRLKNLERKQINLKYNKFLI